MDIVRIPAFDRKDFRKWLDKNSEKEKKVEIVLHKRHTKKPAPSHKELMEEAICYGWIDTVVRKIDEDTYLRTFQKRGKNSRWSMNTLNHAKRLISQKKMTPIGLEFYLQGKKRKAFDAEVPRNPEAPEEFLKILNKNKKAKENFENLPNSMRRAYLRWMLMPKLPETKKKRRERVIKRMTEKDWRTLKF